MIEVHILDLNATEISSIVNDLKSRGHQLHVDFDFAYHPPKFDNFSGEAVYNKRVVFKFHKEELATWFELVYK